MEGIKQDSSFEIIGLSSQEAQQQLLVELQRFAALCCRVNWLKEILYSPYTPISCALTTIAAASLLADYFVTNKEETTTLLQAIALLLFVVLNSTLFAWEVFVLKTRRIRRLLSHIRPLFRANCPWTAHSYPKSSISTKRGHFTVLAYRDRSCVNLPTSLLVKGDIIELHPEIPSPARVALLENPRDHTLDLGQLPPTEVYPSKATSTGCISFIPDITPPKWVVLETPIITLLGTNVTKHRSKTVLTKEKNRLVAGMEVLAIIMYFVALLYNILRFYTHTRDFSDSWPELFLRQPVYTVLPILLVPLPVVWTVVNLYGTATVTLLIEDEAGFYSFAKRACSNSFTKLLTTLSRMCKLLWNHATYPNHRAFHILGSLTSVCAVDKEYLLTGGFPTPEKVFILRTEEFEDSEEGNLAEKGTKKRTEGPSPLKEDSHTTLHMKITEVGTENDRTGGTDRLEAINPLVVKNDSEETVPPTIPQTLVSLNVPEPPDSHSTCSEFSPIGVTKEILDISPCFDQGSGIRFDDLNWQMYLGSLKPIGVNLLTTSHLTKQLSNWQLPSVSSKLVHLVDQTSCACPLGVEIGVSDYSSSGFAKDTFLYSFGEVPSPSKPNSLKVESSVCNAASTIQPHIISLVLKTIESNNYLLMSRGSGDMVISCCSDFWDGKDLQPLTDTERVPIKEFYNRRSTTGYCIALAYNPLLAANTLLSAKTIGMFVPASEMPRSYSEGSMMCSTSEDHSLSRTASQVFEGLQCNQVFLGLVSFQFKPKMDVVALIEDLQTAGVRFVYFTCENEIRGKAFALKLGLETDWNCHISLAPGVEYESLTSETEVTSDLGLSRSSSASSLGSYINNMSNFRAKLPIGIESIRPHIEKVDNVPLQVPLFTDCSTDTIREMIKILQENYEVVLCLGNAWNRDNLSIFSQSDISLSLIPEYVSTSACVETETCALSTSNSSQSTSLLSRYGLWPSPLELAAYLNSTTSQLCFNRDQDVSLLSLITECRHIQSVIRHGLLYGLGSYVSIALLLLLAEIFFLPSPLDGSHLFWFVLFVVPCISLSYLSIPIDPRIKSQMPTRGRKILKEKYLFLFNFSLTFIPTVVISVLLFGLTLSAICASDIPDSDCHSLLGNRNETADSPWNGWRGENEQGLLLAQDLVAFFLCLYLIIHSTRFIHRTKPIWKLWRFVSWQYIGVLVTVGVLQVLYFSISQVFAINVRGLPAIASVSSVPFYVWIVGFVWLVLIFLPNELLKCHDERLLFKLQTRLKLDFETKLGTYSPM